MNAGPRCLGSNWGLLYTLLFHWHKKPLYATLTEFSCTTWWIDILKTLVSSANILYVWQFGRKLRIETQARKNSIQSNQNLQHMPLLQQMFWGKIFDSFLSVKLCLEAKFHLRVNINKLGKKYKQKDGS